MRDHTYIPFIILSAELKTLSKDQNGRRTKLLEGQLMGFRGETGREFHKVVGVYKGDREDSFIVYTSDVKAMQRFAKLYEQESILVRNGHNDCYLHYVSGDPDEFLGHFREVSRPKAMMNHDSYTIIRDRQKEHYWVCEKGPHTTAGKS